MKLNGMKKIDESKGRYIVLCDYGTEGIAVIEQYDDLAEATGCALGHPGNCAIVELVEVRAA